MNIFFIKISFFFCCAIGAIAIPVAANAQAREVFCVEAGPVFRAAIEGYLKDRNNKSALKVNREVNGDAPNLDSYGEACFSKLQIDLTAFTRLTCDFLPEKSLPEKITKGIDFNEQDLKLKKYDPHYLMEESISTGMPLDKKELMKAVKSSFKEGYLTLGQPMLDIQHGKAIIPFSFQCGSLCGHGGIFILERKDKSWGVVKQCEGWVS